MLADDISALRGVQHCQQIETATLGQLHAYLTHNCSTYVLHCV